MAEKIKRIVISVFKDELTETSWTEDEETEAFDNFEADLEDVCNKHEIEVDSVDFETG